MKHTVRVHLVFDVEVDTTGPDAAIEGLDAITEFRVIPGYPGRVLSSDLVDMDRELI